MEKTLSKVAKELKAGNDKAFVRRVMWNDFDKRLRDVFNKLSKNKADLNILGRAYITSNKEHSPFNRKHIYTINSLNQIQIHLGWRLLGVYTAVYENEQNKLEPLAESGAAIWFSQNIFGHVMVFIAPYKSKAVSVNEKDIALGYYRWPTDLDKKEIEKLIKIFLLYCASTSANCEPNVFNYFFRLRLMYKDIRNKKQIRAFIFGFFEKLFFISIAIIGVVATLYAGGKL